MNKEPKPYGYGDWLSWELGFFQPPLKTFTNFGLPMEGYAVTGTLGFVLFPTLVLFPILLVRAASRACGYLSVQSAPVRSGAVADC